VTLGLPDAERQRRQATNRWPGPQGTGIARGVHSCSVRLWDLWKRGRNSSLFARDFEACLCTTARSPERVWLNAWSSRPPPSPPKAGAAFGPLPQMVAEQAPAPTVT
jgi:hypothetical protein